MTNHFFVDQNRNMLTTIVDSDCQPHHIWQDHGTTRPGFDGSALVSGYRCLYLFSQVKVNEWSFF
jgi:hypothetical protein